MGGFETAFNQSLNSTKPRSAKSMAGRHLPSLQQITDSFVPGQGTYQGAGSSPKAAAAAALSTKPAGKPNANANFQMPKPNAPANAAPKGILGKISTYGKAFVTSPSATVKDVASGQGIKAVNNGAIIVNRAPVSVTSKVKQQQAKNLPAGTPGQLDHVQPLEIGGDNNPKNLKLIPKAQDQANNAVENYLGGQLKANVINAQQAKILNQQYKQGKISQQDVYNAAKKGGKPPATSAGLLPKAAVSVGHAGRAVVRPLTDVATGNGGKAVHDTAQLTSDVTGNLANSVADQTRKQVSFLGGKTRTEKGLPGGAQLVKDQQTASKMNLQPTTKQMMKNIYPEAQISATHMLATGKPEADVQKYLQAAQKTKSAGDRKTLATAVATGSFFVGGGEAAAAKDLAKKPLADIAAHTVKDATIGATGNTALTEAQNPNASGKELATSAAVGGAAGGLLPIAAKGAGKAVSKGSSLLRKVPEVNAVINPDHVSQGLVKDTIIHTPSTELHLGSEMAGKKVDNAKVAQYTKQIKDGEPIEPVVVHDVNGQKVVVDGQHRLAAMQKLGITDIPTVEKLPGAEPKAPIAEPAPAATVPKPVVNDVKPAATTEPPKAVTGEAAPAKTPAAPPVDKTAESTPKLSNRKQTQLNPNGPEPTVVPIPEPKPVERTTQEVKTSGSALNAETKAVQKHLATHFEDKAQYGAGSYKDEAVSAVKLVKEDPQKAMDIAMGRTPGDNTIHEVAVARALENKALKEKDIETLQKLATSPRHAVTSEAAQRLGAEGYGEKHSVVQNLARLAEARKAALKARTGKTADTLTKNTIKEAGPAVKTFTPKVTKETWNSFVESLRC